jgi:hypothetical protein
VNRPNAEMKKFTVPGVRAMIFVNKARGYCFIRTVRVSSYVKTATVEK